jgi:hypothetical protein
MKLNSKTAPKEPEFRYSTISSTEEFERWLNIPEDDDESVSEESDEEESVLDEPIVSEKVNSQMIVCSQDVSLTIGIDVIGLRL